MASFMKNGGALGALAKKTPSLGGLVGDKMIKRPLGPGASLLSQTDPLIKKF